MADQRPFRFRLPWLSATTTPAPRPTAEPQPPRPTVQIQAPAQPTTAIPIQRPPFRPPGIAPAQPPTTKAQAQRTEVQPAPQRHETPESQVTPQQVSPSRAAIETQVSSVPSSPSQQTGAASVPLSRAAPQSRAASVPTSPFRATSQPKPAAQTVPPPESPSRFVSRVPEKTPSQPSSPSKTATQVQPTASQPPSPSKKLQISTEEASQPPPISTRPQTSATHEEETKQPVSSVQAMETLEASQKSDSKTIGADHPVPPSEPEKKVIETEERKKVVEELKGEEKTDGPGTQVKELLSTAFHDEQKQKKEDLFERKKTTTSRSNGETFKTSRGRYAFGESHQKQSVSNGEKVPLHKEIREDVSKFVHKLGMEHIKHPIGGNPVTIVTLAGENRGATMHVGSELVRKDGSVHIHRGYKVNPDESTEATTDGEGSSKGRRSDNVLTKEDTATKAYINSNTQSVNNSILFGSSVNERSPGVQLSLSYNQAEPDKSSTKPGMTETHRAEYKVTPSEKRRYEPTVRRRCLRGLFLESSDSDPDNPEKPRRHGCRYNCKEKS